MCTCVTESVRSYYNLILKKAGQFLTDLQVNILKFALALRSYSPAVYASQQVRCDGNNLKLYISKLSQRQLGYIAIELLARGRPNFLSFAWAKSLNYCENNTSQYQQ